MPHLANLHSLLCFSLLSEMVFNTKDNTVNSFEIKLEQYVLILCCNSCGYIYMWIVKCGSIYALLSFR